MENINTEYTHFYILTMCSIRYAIERGNYIPSAIIDIARKHLSDYSKSHLEMIAKDIKDILKTREKHINKALWGAFVKEIEMEIERRREV